jgi:hypothetical protein
VRQLQSNQQAVVRSRGLTVLLNEYFSQAGQTCQRVRTRRELIRVCAPFVAHRNRFATPDQFGPAATESLPASKRMFAGLAVARSVPPFHRLHGETIANLNAVANDRLRQWRRLSVQKLKIAWDHQTKRVKMLFKVSDASKAAQTHNLPYIHLAPGLEDEPHKHITSSRY